MFDDSGPRVDLRGASKKQDRRALLARAQREREERELQRKRAREAQRVQTCYRAHLDLCRARAAARTSFDSEMALAFAPRTAGLIRALLFFFSEAQPADAERLRRLLAQLLQSAAADEAGANACAMMCATEDGAKSWQHLSRRLVELCLPRMLPPRASPDGVELQAVLYLTDATRWLWRPRLAPARATHVEMLAHRSQLELGSRGVHASVAGALGALLPPLTCNTVAAPPAPASPASLLLAPLLAVSMRQLLVACDVAGGAAAEAGLVGAARSLLCAPGLLCRLPHEILSAALPPATLQSLLRALASLGPRLPTLLDSGAGAATASSSTAASPSSAAAALPPLVSLCGSLVHLVSVCGHAQPRPSGSVASASAEATSGAGALGLGDTLPAYVALLHACVAPFAAHALPASGGGGGGGRAGGGGDGSRGGTAAEESDEEPMEVDGGAHGGSAAAAGGGAAADAGVAGGAAVLRESLATLMAQLCAAEHVGELWHAVLAPHATEAEQRAVPLLSAVFCTLRHGADGRGAPQARAAAALSALSFVPESVPRLWQLALLHRPTWGGAAGGAVLWAFCAAFSHLLVTLDDATLLDGERPFGVETLRSICTALKHCAISAHWQTARERVAATTAPGGPPAALRVALLRLTQQLYDRDARRPFMGGPQAWFAEPSRQQMVESLAQRMDPDLLDFVAAEGLDGSAGSTTAGSVAAAAAASAASSGGIGVAGGTASLAEMPEARRVASVLLRMPFTLPFDSRLRILRRWLNQSREVLLAERMMGPPPNTITVRREHLLEDSFAELRGLGSQMRQPLRVNFIGDHGLEEAGLGEGVTKEFLVELIRAGFAPQLGLFCEGGEGTLFPNPAAQLRVREPLALFELLGAVLGKALYEGILVELPLATVFLNRLLGRSNTLNDLPSLDPQLAKSLLFLKSFDGDVEGLCLSFALEQFTGDDVPPHQRRTVDLKPGGANVPVTRANRMEYIFLVARYRLNYQMHRASDAFLRGFSTVVPPSWINMFSPSELQLVLGGSDAPLDVDDWAAHTNYSGGYHADHPTIIWFWEVLRGFDAAQRSAMLKFVSSCSRAPLLGFSWITPMFCIHKAHEMGRLPTSATCMNLLKLPPYDSLESTREKLTYAISAGCGFELS